jgi:hypothetical protein
MFKKHISDFNENIIGLRDFIDLIEPFLKDKVEEHSKHFFPLIQSGLVKDVISKKTEWEEGEKEKYEKLTEKIDEAILEIYKKNIVVEIETKENEIEDVEIAKKKTKSLLIKVKASDTPELQDHLDNAKKVNNHIDLLYRNSFLSLLSTVEWFFSQILHFGFNKHPDAAGIKAKTLTLSDLKTLGSISEAEKFLIDSKIEEILRGDLESWFSKLEIELNLKLGYIKPIKNELVEIYQRRNLLIHNGGVVNSIYLSKVCESNRKEINLNDKLKIDKHYLDHSICKLQKAFLLIASDLWKTLDTTDTSRGYTLLDIVYENLIKERWDICEGLSYFIIKDAGMDVTVKLTAQLNYWLCKKEMNQVGEIKSELDKADYADKKEVFQLALYALKDDINSFIKVLPSALDTKQLSVNDLKEFPIFRTIRVTKEYENFKENSTYFKDSVEEISNEGAIENNSPKLLPKTTS